MTQASQQQRHDQADPIKLLRRVDADHRCKSQSDDLLKQRQIVELIQQCPVSDRRLEYVCQVDPLETDRLLGLNQLSVNCIFCNILYISHGKQ